MVNHLEVNMKKTILKIIPMILLIMGCDGGAKPVESPANLADNSGSMTLEQALKEAADRIDERITAGSKIAPLNFNSSHDKFSSYVLDELTANLVDTRKLTGVDRKEVDLIRGDFDFQFSGEVGDDSMQELGRMLGAQAIISGSLTDMGGFYRIVIRVLNVQNASVEVQYRANIASDNIMAALLTGGRTGGTAGTPQRASTAQAPEVQVPAPVQAATPAPSTPLKTGTWRVSGNDEQRTIWSADLIVQNYRNNTFTGYFDWYSGTNETYRGREYYEGEYNALRQRVILRGTRLERAPGLGLGVYQARVSDDGMKLITGSWGEGVPGTWEAEWLKQ
jgi:TolB-like protein